MTVRFHDLTRQQREIEPAVLEALTRVAQSESFILGPEVEAFEEEWKEFCGTRGAVAVANGTDALTLALVATGAVRQNAEGARDEVITSSLTAGYTALAIMNAGGVPVFADIDPVTYTLDVNSFEAAITSRTRAVVPVHIYGQMANMEAICRVAAHHNLIVIEDAAQAHGANLGVSGRNDSRGNLRIGSRSAAAAFSFYPTKNLGACGDGGAIISNDKALIERIKILRQGGHHPALQGRLVGCNSRLDEMQAALLRIKLPYLTEWNRQRQQLSRMYDQGLRQSRLRLPMNHNGEGHVYHLYVVQHPERDQLRSYLTARGIETLVHYPYLLHQQPLFRRRSGQLSLPIAEHIGKKIFSLPLYPQLTFEEVQQVVDAILDYETQIELASTVNL